MQQEPSSWAVVATVMEPPILIQAFVAWYLWLGAARIYLYFDDPDDPAAALLSHLPQVQATLCDDAYWRSAANTRPPRHQGRQVHNAEQAYQMANAAWLLHCDADEFLWPAGTVAGMLADVPAHVDALVSPVAERVHLPRDPGISIFEGGFRRPFAGPPPTARRLFGTDYDLTNRGLTGHTLGKSLIRTGRAMRPAIHRPHACKKGDSLTIMHADRSTLELLHFEGLTPTHWAAKLRRRMEAVYSPGAIALSPHRARQAAALAADPGQGAALYDRLKRLDTAQMVALEAQALLARPVFSPELQIKRYFNYRGLGFAHHEFDQWLNQYNP